MTTIHGVPLSPFVRKVLTVLSLKGVEYTLNPVVPFDLPEGFEAISPLRKIPVLEDDQVTLADSTAICEYLDERYGGTSILPDSVADRARCRWFEEYADTGMADALVFDVFFERLVKPSFLQQPTDEAKVSDALENKIPPILAYLENEVPGADFMYDGRLTMADIALASIFINAAYGDFRIDAQAYPKLAAYIEFVWAQPPIMARLLEEKTLLEGFSINKAWV